MKSTTKFHHHAVVVCGFLLQSALAQDSGLLAADGDWWTGDYLTGGWRGKRTDVEDRGVQVFAEYTADNLWNTRGGLRTGYSYMAMVEFGVELDLELMTDWWRGGRFKVSGLNTHRNRGLTEDLIGDLNGASNLEAPPGTLGVRSQATE